MPVNEYLKKPAWHLRDLTMYLYGWGNRQASRLSLNQTVSAIGLSTKFPTVPWFSFGFLPIEFRLKKVRRFQEDVTPHFDQHFSNDQRG